MSLASNRLPAHATLATLLLALSAHSHGAGFAIIEQSVSGLGNAFAGAAASSQDASTIYFNPAGMTQLPERELVGAAHVIFPSFEFADAGSRTTLGTPLSGGDGGDAGETKVVPNFYYARALNERTRVGLGVGAPFGLATDYDSDWKGRYQALKSEVATVNINPSIAHALNKGVSVGFGVNAQYLDAQLTSAVDFAVACLGAAPPAACAAQGLGPTNVQTAAASGHSDNTADDWGWGYNFGVLFEPMEGTRVGLAYRSKIDYELEGQGDFTLASNVANAAGNGNPAATLAAVFTDSPITVDITMPETLSLSAYHEINSRWAVMGDITRTRWSRIPELRIEFANPLKSDSVEVLDWEDVNRYSLGVNYRYSNQLVIRGGLAYDETPVPDAARRTPRLPDNDRRWIAVGFSYRGSDRFSFDFGYAHLFLSDTAIDRTGLLNDQLTGTYESEVDIASAQVRWQF